MSVLIMKKLKETHRKGRTSYQIVRQDEKLRNRDHHVNVLEHSKGKWYEVISVGCPTFMHGTIFLRGHNHDMDDNPLHVADEDVRMFERTVLEVNRRKSNNTHLEIEDVIWEDA